MMMSRITDEFNDFVVKWSKKLFSMKETYFYGLYIGFSTIMFILLHPERWMTPSQCLADDWFRYFVVLFGTLTSIMYLMFSYIVLVRLKENISKFFGSKFAHYLGVVFIMCAIVHFMHAWAYHNQYFKIVLLYYPVLDYNMIMLFIISARMANSLEGAYTKEQMETFNMVLKDKVDSKMAELKKDLRKKDTEGIEEFEKKIEEARVEIRDSLSEFELSLEKLKNSTNGI